MVLGIPNLVLTLPALVTFPKVVDIVIFCQYLDHGSSNRLIGHLYFELGSNFISHKPLIEALTHPVTSSIYLGFTSPYTLRIVIFC